MSVRVIEHHQAAIGNDHIFSKAEHCCLLVHSSLLLTGCNSHHWPTCSRFYFDFSPAVHYAQRLPDSQSEPDKWTKMVKIVFYSSHDPVSFWRKSVDGPPSPQSSPPDSVVDSNQSASHLGLIFGENTQSPVNRGGPEISNWAPAWNIPENIEEAEFVQQRWGRRNDLKGLSHVNLEGTSITCKPSYTETWSHRNCETGGSFYLGGSQGTKVHSNIYLST
jgi:hypothetical protein